MSDSSTPAPPARKRNWRRRIFIAVAVLVGLAVLLRLLIVVAFPPVFRSVAARYGFKADYGRMELYFLGTDVGLWDVNLRPLEGGEPLISSNYCRVNVSTLNLLRGRLVVRRLEADTVNVHLDREADGSIPLVQKLTGGAHASELAALESQVEKDIIELTSPLQIEAFRLSRVRARVRDQSVTPPLDSTFDLNVRLDDFASAVRPTKFQVELSSNDLLDVMRIEGEGRAHRQNLDATLRIFVRGLHPEPAAGYLALLGLKPAAGDISFQLGGTLKAWPATQPAATGKPAPPPVMQGSLQLAGVTATADLQQSVSLSRVQLDADAITTRRADFSKLIIEGIRCNARRTSDGGFWVGGMKVFALQPGDVPTTQPTLPASPARPPVAAAAPAPRRSLMNWRLGEFALRDVQATLHDDYIAPRADVTVRLDELSVKNIVNDPADASAVAQIAATLSAPGIVQSATVSGSARPFAPTRTLELQLAAEGLRPDSLKPYLDAAGIESLLKLASFTTNVAASGNIDSAGRITADATIDQARLIDGGEELFAMDRIRIAGALLDPTARSIRVDQIELTGPRVDGRRESSGALAMLGLRIAPSGGRTSQPKAVAANGRDAHFEFPVLPGIEIGKLTWTGARVRFDDEFVTPASRIELADSGVEIANLRLGNSPTTQPAEPGTIRAWLASPGLAERIDVSGTITPSPAGTSLDLQLTGNGITASALAPHLRAVGIEPVLKDGALAAAAQLAFERERGASLWLRDVRFADAGEELLGIDSLKLTELRIAPREISVGALELDHPRARVMRESDGALAAGGIRTLQPATQPAAAAQTERSPLDALSLPIAVAVTKLLVGNASLQWVDRAAHDPVDATLNADVQVDSLVLGRAGDPAKVAVKLSSPNAFESIDVKGTVSLAPQSPSISLKASGTGITGGVAQAYLPAGVTLATQDGQFRAAIDASVSPVESGGHAASVVVSDVSWQDGEQGPKLLALESAKLLVPRFDPRGKVIDVDEISLSGLEAETYRDAAGKFHALGLAFGGAGEATPPSTSPALAAAPSTARKALDSLPLVSLASLDLGVKRIAFTDQSRPESAPLAAEDFSLRNRQPIQLLGNDPAALPPAEFVLTGRVDPLIREVAGSAQIAPFSTEVIVKANLTASGISGEGLVRLFPKLRDRVDGSTMTDGRFGTEAELTLRAGRRGLVDFDPARPFDLDLLLKGTEFRSSADGPILAGLEELRADDVRVDPPGSTVAVKSLELTKPIGRLLRDDQGIHVLGWTIKLPQNLSGNGSAPSLAAPEPVAQIAASETPAPSAPTTRPAGGEFRIDRLLISGIDLVIEDRAVQPPLLVPLTGLDVEVRGLTTRALSEDRPVRFVALLNSGKVPLVNEKGETRDREVFAQAAATGRLSLYPQPKGWIKSSVSGLELVALAGEAKQAEIELGGGVFDGAIDTRIPGDGSIDNNVRIVFTDLKLSEAPGGPIQRILQLPQPLDAVIGVLQDPSGGITVPLNVPLEQGQLNRGAVIGSAVGAVAGVVATGLASSPIKVATGVGALVGLEDKDKEKTEEPLMLTYAAGESSLSADDSAVVQEVLQRLDKDRNLEVTLRQQLGGGDIARAAVRANPSAEDARELAYRLRKKKLDLQAQRAELAGRTRAELAARSPAEAEAYVARLRAIDREVAATDDLLDRIYDLLRPGADRQADRRTRAAAIALGQARLDAVRDILVAGSHARDMDQRVKVVRATFAAPDDPADSAGGRLLITISKRPKQ